MDILEEMEAERTELRRRYFRLARDPSGNLGNERQKTFNRLVTLTKWVMEVRDMKRQLEELQV